MKLLVKESYINAIKNGVGTNMFRNLFAEIDGEKVDITEDGNLSCAVFVSSLLYMFKLIYDVHANVFSVVKDLELFGWREIKEPKEGAVVVWKKRAHGEGAPHSHIGFITKNNKAVSNDFEAKTPIEHELNFRGGEIEKILWNTKLD